MVVNNGSNNVQLLGDLDITNQLTLTSGDVIIGSNDLHITTTSSSGISGGGSGSYIQANGTGVVRRNVAVTTTYDYPVGDNLSYSPFQIYINSGTLASASISINVTNGVHPSMLGADYISRYWTVTPTGITNPDYNAVYSYDDTDVNGDENSIAAAKFNASGLGPYADTGTNTFTWNNITSFSEFTGGNPSVLPVDLLYFEADLVEDQVFLSWATTSELNNDYFTIERSADGKNFEPLIRIDGNGDSEELILYESVDEWPLVGLNYYRLKQTDFDGKYSYSAIVAVKYTSVRPLSMEIFPNPVTGGTFTAQVSGLLPGQEINLSMIDLYGHRLITMKVAAGQNGLVETMMRLGPNIPAGVYIVELLTLDEYLHEKILVH